MGHQVIDCKVCGAWIMEGTVLGTVILENVHTIGTLKKYLRLNKGNPY